jgi:hypothetical protein
MTAAARRNFKGVRRWSNEDSPDPNRLSRRCVGNFGGEAGSYFIPFVGSVAAEYGSTLRLERAYCCILGFEPVGCGLKDFMDYFEPKLDLRERNECTPWGL